MTMGKFDISELYRSFSTYIYLSSAVCNDTVS